MKNVSTQELVPMIFSLNRLIREQISGQGNITSLSLAQIKILAFILEKNAPTMKEIASSLLIALPSATSAINRLAKDGYLKRISDENDRRIVRLEITSKGKEMYDECYKDVLQKMEKILAPLSEKEVTEYASILSKIIASYNH